MSKESQSKKIQRKAARRAERKLPVSGSEPTEDPPIPAAEALMAEESEDENG